MRQLSRACYAFVVAAGAFGPMSADAQLGVFERLVSPGALITAHAEYEEQCASCHVRFSRQRQNDLCLDCHDEISEDLIDGTGFHSLSADVAGADCAQCHTDHEGRDAQIVDFDRDTFDHDLTDFSLVGSHVGLECDGCHVADEAFHQAETECVACHADDDQHLGNLGEVCSDCHSPSDWADAVYDHALESGYALLGAHEELMCVSCHVGEVYEDTSDRCVDCHRDDDTHAGANGAECQDCHGPTDWATTTFDHFSLTGFALAGSHSGLECTSCHEGSVFEQTRTSECVSCHLDDDAHDGINGEICSDCHAATSWLDVSFDHARDTDFALLGSHGVLECADCHVEPVAVAVPSTLCIDCHAEDEPHAGQLGSDCSSCHREIDWAESVRFDHGLTQFPLLGRHEALVCDDCHESQAFHDAPDQCVDCHGDDDVHMAALGPQCVDCHTPLDWALWQFDHGTQTDFALTGAHNGLACSACHNTPAVDGSPARDQSCQSCHRSDDVHRGAFGSDCETCHSTRSFGDLRAIQ